MPRHEDRYGNTRLYVGHLGARTRSRDLEDLFGRYGRFLGFCRTWRVRDVDMKRDYAFVEFSDYRDADDARHSLNGREFDGSRIIVEFSRGGPRGSAGGSREHSGRGAPPGSGRCFNCGLDGHWARDCKAGDWKNKCYRCGDRGHIERNCQNSPKSLKRGRSYSRSPTPRRGGRSRSRSYSRSRSSSRSRSPQRRDERSRSRSLQYSRSPEPKGSPAEMKDKKRSPTPLDRSPSQDRASLSPRGRDRRQAADRNGSDYSGSPRENGMTPTSPEKRESSPNGGGYGKEGANGRSPSPANDRSDDDNRGSPRGSRSPSNP